MIYLFIALIFYAIAILFGTAASRNVNTNLAAGLQNVLAAVIPLAVAIPFISKKAIQSHKFGIVMALLGGISIAIFAMALNKSFAMNKVGIVTPIVFGGAIFLSTLLSTIVFKEKITAIEALGLTVLAIGFGIIIYARAVAE